VIIHVGACCVKDAQKLARHAKEIGADGFGAVPPFYHKPRDIPTLIQTMAEIAREAPELPFYYYHFPNMTGVNFPMASFFSQAENIIPNLVGMKFTHTELGDLHECSTLRNGYYNLLLGDDTALASALTAGIEGGIGSSYQIPCMIPIYKNIIEAFNAGNMEELHSLQATGIKMCRIYGGTGKVAISHLKHILRLAGYQVGQPRYPLPPLTKAEENSLENLLRENNFI